VQLQGVERKKRKGKKDRTKTTGGQIIGDTERGFEKKE